MLGEKPLVRLTSWFKTKPTRSEIFCVSITVGLALLALFVWGAIVNRSPMMGHIRHPETLSGVNSRVSTPAAAKPLARESVSAGASVHDVAQASAAWEAKLRLALAQPGDGTDRIFERQLEENPGIAEHETFAYRGNPKDTAEVRRWAVHAADLVSIAAGFRDPVTGQEFRISRPGHESFVLAKTAAGQLTVNVYTFKTVAVPAGGRAAETGFDPVPVSTISVARNPAHGQFPGWLDSGGHPPTWGKLYIPGFNSKGG